MTTTSFRAAALEYVERGWHVLPLVPRDKRPITGAGYAGGVYNATNDPELVERLWSRWPTANVGIAMGPSGIVAIDIDPRNAGDEVWSEWLKSFGPCPETVEAITGGDGRHILFRDPGVPLVALIRESASPRAEFEIKQGWKYIVAAPSVHPSGKAYEWEASSDPRDVELASLPEHWITGLRGAAPAPRVHAGSAAMQITESPIYRIALEWGLGPRVIGDGSKAAVTCPWAHGHTHNIQRSGQRVDTSAVILAPLTRWEMGSFRCQHAHCEGRRGADFIAAAPLELVRRHRPKAGW